MSNADWLVGLERFSDLFSYLPTDIVNFILAVIVVLAVLAIRRVLY